MNATEFREYVQASFARIAAEYGLRPLPRSPGAFANAFEVRLGNSTTVLAIEGINYGFGVDVRLASSDRHHMRFPTYCLDDLLAIRAPEFEHVRPGPDDTNEIQKRQIDAYAAALPKYADDVLRGDFSVFPQLAHAIQERKKRYDSEMEDLVAGNVRAGQRKPWWKFW
jgi:hypothetical protein